MNAIGNIPAVIIPQQTASVPAALPAIKTQDTAPILPQHDDTPLTNQATDKARYQAVIQAAEEAPHPLGTQKFIIYKDTTGQYITRFRDETSGRVTYIPEPSIFKLNGNSTAPQSPALLKITA